MSGETFVYLELVREGYALAATYPPDVACANVFVSAQGQARSEQVGLWLLTAQPLWTPMSAPEPTTTAGGGNSNCDPSYPTVCIPPLPPDLDRKDVPYRKFKVLLPNPHHFDGDGDGIGCEGG